MKRRPRLTRKRIEGLRIIGEVIDQQLLGALVTRAERRKVRTARQWIDGMVRRQEHVTAEAQRAQRGKA